jgi:bifunctional non-homologous end joining protein LigD
VATPIEWPELDDPDLDSQSYNVKNIFRRLGQKEDPWKRIMDQTYSLTEAQEKLKAMRV